MMMLVLVVSDNKSKDSRRMCAAASSCEFMLVHAMNVEQST